MKKKIVVIVGLCLIILVSLCFKFYNTKNSFMTIMFNSSTKTYYYKLDLKYNTYKKIYSKENNGYSDGVIAKDGSGLYYTDNVNGNSNLYKTNGDSNSNNIQLTKNTKVDMFCLGNNKIFCRVIQKNHSNNSLAILNLLNNKLNICYKQEKDEDIFKLEYNQFTHKIYTIESSLKERNNIHLPNMPLDKIMEYDENGNKIKELFQIKGYINDMSVSKDGSTALVSVFTGSGSINEIYVVNLVNSSKRLIIKSTMNYIATHPIFSTDGKGFYFLAINSDSKVLFADKQHVERSRGIYYYDLTTKKISTIFNKNDGFVNDYNLQY